MRGESDIMSVYGLIIKFWFNYTCIVNSQMLKLLSDSITELIQSMKEKFGMMQVSFEVV
jgi:hypothetical protein